MNLFNGRVQVQTGDITLLHTDAIVNAANSSLLGGSGVDGAIHHAAGGDLLNECRQIRKDKWPDGLPTGEAVLSGAGKLPCRFVIHTVGPVWHGGKKGERELLQNAYRNSLLLAEEQQLSSIAFPAISTGVYGYPSESAASVVYEVLRDFTKTHAHPEKIILIFYSPGGMRTFLSHIPVEGE